MCGAQLLTLPPAVQHTASWLQTQGHADGIRWLEVPLDQAHAAADALFAHTDQLVQCSLWQASGGLVPYMCLTPVLRPMQPTALLALLGQAAGMPPNTTLHALPWALGACPLASAAPATTFMDNLWREDEVLWCSAGHPQAVFAVTTTQLRQWTHATVGTLSAADL